MTNATVNIQVRNRWDVWRLQFNANLRRFRSDCVVFFRNRLAVIGILLLFMFAAMTFIHPLLLATVWPPQIYNVRTGFNPAIMHPSLPSATHLLGTDAIGRDVLSMLLASTRSAFVIGITAASITAIVAITVAVVSAYFRGVVDAIFTHISDAFLLVPIPLLLVILATRFGQDMTPAVFGTIYGIMAGIGGGAIVIRAQAISIMEKPFIEATRASGSSAWHIITAYLIPHILPLTFVYMMLSITGAIVADGFASFFGLNRGYMNWGSMIYLAFEYLSINPQIPWNVLIPPSVALSLFAASFYLISRGLHDVAEPRLRGR
ncbi:MAG: ABC transporter permease [Chloroflexota bacterium]